MDTRDTDVGTTSVNRDESRIDGVVESFDRTSGLGSVRASDGSLHAFHCTSIADGSRDIGTGRKVTFRIDWRVLRWEAVDIRDR